VSDPVVVRSVDGESPASGHLRVAAVQFSVGTDVDENLATCLRMIDAAAAEGAQVIVLPEFCNHVSWYDDREHSRRMAVTLDGPFVTAIAAKAKEHSAHVMVNVVVAREDGRTTGTNVLCSPEGKVIADSDKQVLMGSERLHLDDAISTGPIIETDVARFGMYSCMDGVINETPRGLALRGAQVLLNSLNSFALDEANLHIPVRAPENRVWIVAANKVGPLIPPGNIEQVSTGVGVPVERLHGAGESQIVAPDGTVVAQGPLTGEAVVVADIDVSAADAKTRPDGTDVFANRRPELYAALADAPKGRQAPAGAAALRAAVVQPSADGDEAIPAAAAAVAQAVADGAELVVMPELFCFAGGVVDVDTAAAEARAAEAVAAIAAVAGSAHVVTSLPAGSAHEAVLIGAEGVVARQRQLHAVARHGWVNELGDGLQIVELPWGRLALVVGDDAVYPETFRLAALADADVVALPFTVAESWELRTGLVERAAENRLNLVAATRPGPAGASVVIPLTGEFTLWSTERTEPFNGVISRPDPVLIDPSAEVTVVEVSPAQATNRMVSRGTDLVDGRPWQLIDAITG
jgi:predicted amidohydrolase